MMMSAMTASVVVAWQVQTIDLLLGHTIGVFGILLSAIFGVDYMARRMK